MLLQSKITKATTSLTFLTALLALSGCYTSLRTSARTDAAGPDTSRVDAQPTGSPIDASGLGGVDGFSLGGQGGGVGEGGTGGFLDGSALGGAGGSVEDAPISTGGTTSSGGVPAAGGSTSTQDASSTLPKGASCAVDSQCADGHCVDGVCCNDKCTGPCQACNESGSVGTCKTVQGDPRGTRAACAGSGKCKGQCDGTNAAACLMPGTSTVCKDPSCAIGVATAASTCNGSGTCITPAAKQCASNLCATDGSGTCAGSCTPTSCPTGFYCDSTGNCAQKKASGSGNICSTGAECSSGHCSFEGICCNSDCTGQCQTCNNSSGTCSRVTSGQPVGGRAACTKAGTTCGGACDGSSDTACHYPGTDLTCGSASCSSDNASTVTPACNGSGSCSSSATNSCGSSAYCSSGSCTPKGSGSCTNNVQCTSGNCSNGLCCASGLTNSNGVCCASGLTGCNGQCVNTNTSSTYCGSCTNSCSGSKTCSNGQCACPLGGAQASCGTCLSWDFESGTSLSDTNGWVRDPSTWTSSLFSMSRVVSPTYNNSGHSLAITVNNSGGFGIKVPVCSTTDLSNLNFSAQVRIHDLGGASTVDVMNLMFSAPENSFTPAGWLVTRTVGTDSWIPITGGADWPNGTSSVGLYFSLNTDSWSGTVYLDNVVFSP
jgi:hypothetical protein